MTIHPCPEWRTLPTQAEQWKSEEEKLIQAIVIALSLLLVVSAALWMFYRMRRLHPQVAGYASQRMCPACGLITPRSKSACQECGKLFNPTVG